MKPVAVHENMLQKKIFTEKKEGKYLPISIFVRSWKVWLEKLLGEKIQNKDIFDFVLWYQTSFRWLLREYKNKLRFQKDEKPGIRKLNAEIAK